MRYQIEADCDYDNWHSQDEHDAYTAFQDKYCALSIGHDKTRTSTLFFSYNGILKPKDLRGIPVISIAAIGMDILNT